MTTEREWVFVSVGTCHGCSAPTMQAHHQNYPEAVAEGTSVVSASENLINQLTRSLDHVLDRERREAIEQAITEVRDFMTRHNPAPAVADDRTEEGEYSMAIPHAQPGEVIDVRPLGSAIASARTMTLVKTESLEVIRLLVSRGKEIPTHATRGEITVQCLEGRVAFTVGGVERELAAGQLLYLASGQPHSVLGIDDASLLLTLTFSSRQ